MNHQDKPSAQNATASDSSRTDHVTPSMRSHAGPAKAAGLSYTQVLAVYEGSDGNATNALYAKLRACGPRGVIAMNLFRACKNSARAKVYRGGNEQGSYRAQAYERKAWAIRNLCETLAEHAADYQMAWGWGVDPSQVVHTYVLYVDTPQGQVSFHTATLEAGPQYPGQWDGVRRASVDRICRWCSDILCGDAGG